MTPLLGLVRFESPLDAAWQARAVASFCTLEQARLARIERPLRRGQFIVAHRMLRWLLAAAGLDDATIEVEAGGLLRLASASPAYASIAHSQNTVAVIVAGVPVGVDVEAPRTLRDPRAAAELMGTGLAADDSDSVLRAWTQSEARVKSGPKALDNTWSAYWQGCQLAVAGVVIPPLTVVFELTTGTYNAAELRWESATAVHNGT